MAIYIWVIIGSGNDLLPDGTKPSITEISFEIGYLKFYSDLPGANELRMSAIIATWTQRHNDWLKQLFARSLILNLIHSK